MALSSVYASSDEAAGELAPPGVLLTEALRSEQKRSQSPAGPDHLPVLPSAREPSPPVQFRKDSDKRAFLAQEARCFGLRKPQNPRNWKYSGFKR